MRKEIKERALRNKKEEEIEIKVNIEGKLSKLPERETKEEKRQK